MKIYLYSIIYWVKVGCKTIKDYALNHQKQITDIVAIVSGILGIMDTYFGAPKEQILIKIAIFVIAFFHGREGANTNA